MIECEVKLKINNPDTIKQKLLALGFIEGDHLTETDIYFDNKNGDIRSNDNALRIRETVNHSSKKSYYQFNYKGKKLDDVSVSRPEYELEISDSVAMKTILEQLGYYPVSPIVVKARTLLHTADINACLDSVKDLGDFLELEVMAETEELKDRELERIGKILNSLGYSISETTTISYLSALQKQL